ncbi:MAG: pseudouridine synthase [Candidatus Cloacimonadia bacterium]
MRINRFLAQAGFGSRRTCEELIKRGKVKINNIPVSQLATQVNPEIDKVTVNGKEVQLPHQKIYIMLNKPSGYIVTATDPYNRKTIFNLLPELSVRVFSVGRLDMQSTGLLLLTNDGDFANAIIHPRNKIPKTYIVKAKGILTYSQLKKLRNGIMLDEEYMAKAKVIIKSYNKKQGITKLRMTIYEGKNRQLRRMIQAVGSSVISLKRVQIGNLRLASLPEGAWRFLKNKEVAALWRKENQSAKP